MKKQKRKMKNFCMKKPQKWLFSYGDYGDERRGGVRGIDELCRSEMDFFKAN